MDQSSLRDLPYARYFGNDNTPGSCVARCKSKGYPFAAVVNGNDCSCGHSFGRYGRAQDVECEAYRCTAPGYVGCFMDRGSPHRDLPHLKIMNGITPRKCALYCKSKKYLYAGVQNSNECFCGKSFGQHGKVPDNECDKRCSGDKQQNCGSGWRNQIYSTDEY
uniref:WSC domain-containing protein n=1 Tax=Macrostomum lignano TaxID=282301 RepID=A0A1I8H0H5_9PLAT